MRVTAAPRPKPGPPHRIRQPASGQNDTRPVRRTGYGNPQGGRTTRAVWRAVWRSRTGYGQPASGQNDTDMFIEIVRGAPSQAAFSTIAARYEASKRLFATSDTCAAPKRSVSDSTEKVR